MVLTAEGAVFVDSRLAPVGHKVGVAATEKLCGEALDRFDPAEAEERRRTAAESRRVDAHTDDPGRTGTADIVADTDLADALDFETALRQAAEQLAADGSTDSLGVRRSQAVGVIARHYLGVLLNVGREQAGPLVKARRMTINVHVRDQGTGRCEKTRAPISVDQVQSWCTNPDTQVVIRKIIDLNQHIRVDAYEVPDRLEDQVSERDGTCVHPYCNRPARRCDKDHCVPYDERGPTCSHNIAPLCRRHHRAKTHSGWTYWFLRPGSYLWRSPGDLWFFRDGIGTTDLGTLANIDVCGGQTGVG